MHNEALPLRSVRPEVQGIADALWARIGRASVDTPAVRVLFVGLDEGAGSTTLAAATAMLLALDQRVRIHLVETNFVDPRLAEYLGVPRSPGFTDVLDRGERTKACLHPLDGCPDLFVLPAGIARRSVPGELRRPTAGQLFREVCEDARCVIIDAPPLEGRVESRALLDHADYVVPVLAARQTKRDALRRALRVFDDFQVPVLGAVLNRYRSDLPFKLGEGSWP